MIWCCINRLIDKYLIYAFYKPIYMYRLHKTTSWETWLALLNFLFVIGSYDLLLPNGKPLLWLLFHVILSSSSRQKLPW